MNRSKILVWCTVITAMFVYTAFRKTGAIVAQTPWEMESSQGVLALDENNFLEAKARLDAAMQLAQQSGSESELGTSDQNLAQLCCAERRFSDAIQHYTSAIDHLNKTKSPPVQWATLYSGYAIASVGAHDLKAAERLIRIALDFDATARAPNAQQTIDDQRILSLILVGEGSFSQSVQAATRATRTASTRPLAATDNSRR